MFTKKNYFLSSGIATFFVFILLFYLSALAQDDYTDWNIKTDVTINTSGSGLTGSVSNFPVLVRLTSSNFRFDLARGSGQDIRFSKSTGTHLRAWTRSLIQAKE